MDRIVHRPTFLVATLVMTLWAGSVWSQSMGWFSVAEQGTIENLSERFATLKRGEMPEGFFGFHTRNVDAMYFAYEDDVFWFEYEIADDERRAFVQPIKDLAKTMGQDTSDGSYGKTPIVRVRLTSTEEDSAQMVQRIAKEIFQISIQTTVEFVP